MYSFLHSPGTFGCLGSPIFPGTSFYNNPHLNVLTSQLNHPIPMTTPSTFQQLSVSLPPSTFFMTTTDLTKTTDGDIHSIPPSNTDLSKQNVNILKSYLSNESSGNTNNNIKKNGERRGRKRAPDSADPKTQRNREIARSFRNRDKQYRDENQELKKIIYFLIEELIKMEKKNSYQ